jgi:murein L,D-transpeptidase YcbB/YkuD
MLVNFTQGHGTATWQQQMANRGWALAVDDLYGGESEQVCRQFQSEKGLDADGVVGPLTWDATWTAPVT